MTFTREKSKLIETAALHKEPIALIIGVTERATFRRCRRQWLYSSYNTEALEPFVPSTSLELGGLVHRALAAWLLDQSVGLEHHYRTAALEENKRIIQRYVTQVGTSPSDEELQPFFDGVLLGQAMCQNYQKRWGTPLPFEFELVYPEQEIQVAIPGTAHSLRCRFDGLLKDKRGSFYVLEHKTYGNRPNMDDLQMNDQFLGYLWVLQQLDLGPLGGVAYDGMWKRAVPPKGSTLEDLFLRRTLFRSEDELAEFSAFLADEANEMEMVAQGKLAAYINRPWTGCRDCGYRELCLRQSRGEDVEAYKASRFTKRQDIQLPPDQQVFIPAEPVVPA